MSDHLSHAVTGEVTGQAINTTFAAAAPTVDEICFLAKIDTEIVKFACKLCFLAPKS